VPRTRRGLPVARGCESESFRLNGQSGIAERCSGFAFQTDERLWQTLIGSNAHHFHLRDEIAVRKEHLGGENLCADFQSLIQIRLIAIRNTEISIAKEVFQLVGHRENHRILRKAFRDHDGHAQIIINKGAAQVSESIRPLIQNDFILRINPHQIAGENAR